MYGENLEYNMGKLMVKVKQLVPDRIFIENFMKENSCLTYL